MLHGASVPVLLGIGNAMRALRYLPMRRDHWLRAAAAKPDRRLVHPAAPNDSADFLTMRKALATSGIPVVDTALARSEEEAVAAQQRFGVPAAIKAEMPGLIHKSDIGCVVLGCAGADEVVQAYRSVVANAREAGFKGDAQVLIQPMVKGVAEAYAGVIDDALFGPAICFGLGGIFVEIFNDARTEMAPLTRDDALAMIHGIKSSKIFAGARGRDSGDIDALADLLVRLGQFALANAGRFRAFDLNPIIVKGRGEGVIAVDIAFDMAAGPTNQAATAQYDAAAFAERAAS